MPDPASFVRARGTADRSSDRWCRGRLGGSDVWHPVSPAAEREAPSTKIIGWQKAGGQFAARGYIIMQEDNGSDRMAFLESIETIEAETGLDFFADLDDEAEEQPESLRFTTPWDNE
jgi:hypothetical protein